MITNNIKINNQSSQQQQQTPIGCLADFYTPYEWRMTGDFPFKILTRKGMEIYIPLRTKDELKRLHTKRYIMNKVTSGKLVRQCQKAYETKPGIGYFGTTYTYQNIGELVGCKTFYKVDRERNDYHLLKCVGTDLTAGIERAIFKDHSGVYLLTHEDLHQLGYSRIFQE